MKVADTREVLVADLGPGGLMDVMLALAEANVNVDLAYTALGGSKVVIATDDVLNARDALTLVRSQARRAPRGRRRRAPRRPVDARASRT